MRLAETMGQPDWVGLGRAIPQQTWDGWLDHFEREPFGANQLYEFLANAFVLLASAFHSPKLARDLTKQHFKWWDTDPTASEPLGDDDILRSMKHWEALQKDGSV